jgi:hypothetical protein
LSALLWKWGVRPGGAVKMLFKEMNLNLGSTEYHNREPAAAIAAQQLPVGLPDLAASLAVPSSDRSAG